MKFKFSICLACALSLFAVCAVAQDQSHYHYQQFSVDQGLTHHSITALSYDNERGLLWVGTSMGVNVISSAKSMTFSSYLSEDGYHELGKVTSIVFAPQGNEVLFCCDDGVLVHNIGGLFLKQLKYNGKNIQASALACHDTEAYMYVPDQAIVLKYDFISKTVSLVSNLDKNSQFKFEKIVFLEGVKEFFILAEKERGLFMFDIETGKLTNLNAIGGDINVEAIMQDKYGTLWVPKYNKGVWGYKPLENFRLYKTFTTHNSKLPHDNVISIAETKDSHLCVGTDGGGLFFIDKATNVNVDIADAELVKKSQVLCAIGNDLVAGTPYNGLIILRKNPICVLSDNAISGDIRLSNNIIQSIFDDGDGVIWLGTSGGGINKFDERSRTISYYPETKGMQIIAIAGLDKDRLLILSLYDNVYIFDKRTGKISTDPLTSDLGITFDHSGNHNIITCNTPDGDILGFNLNGRHVKFNLEDKVVRDFTIFDKGNVNDDVIVSAFPFKGKVAAISHFSIYDINSKTLVASRLYTHSSRITSSSVDADGNIWFASMDGVYKYNRMFNELVKVIDTKDSESYFKTIVVDKFHDCIWLVSNDNKVSVVNNDVNVQDMQYYSQEDGLPLNNNFFSKGMISASGRVYLPGSCGLCVINPYPGMKPRRDDLQIKLTHLSTDEKKEYNTQGGARLLLPGDFSSLKLVVGVTRVNPISSLDMDFVLKKNNEEIYHVQTNDPMLHFSKLDKGSYTLYGRVFCKNGWTEMSPICNFKVLGLFIDYILPVFCVFCILILIVCILLPLVRKKKQAIVDKRESERKELQKQQLQYVRQISFKSLQSVILSISNIEKGFKNIQNKYNVEPDLVEYLNSLSRQINIEVNSLILINDAQNPDGAQIPLEISNVEIVPWIESIVAYYKVSARMKGLDIVVKNNESGIDNINVDRKKIEIVIGMLLSNAIKFSDKGTIQVVISRSTLGNLKISVIDEGRGIKGNPDVLFSPFEREDRSLPGIGLSLYTVKNIVERMNGQVGVYKNLTVGSTFFITLPINMVETEPDSSSYPSSPKNNQPESVPEETVAEMEQVKDIEMSLESLVQNELSTNSAEDEIPKDDETVPEPVDDDPFLDKYAIIDPETEFNTLGYTLLIVDDQEDNLDFIKEEYEDLFKKIYVAHDGAEGLEVIREKMPSIVVSDIMMPRMNGFEMCKAVKSDLEISHLPIVLLTAKSDSTYQEVGYKLGADAFVPKPFDTRVLYNILKGQLKNRFEIKRQYATTSLPEITEEYTFSIADEKFVQKMNKYINDNISNPDLNVDMIVDHMCVSRSTLFNKMRSLCGVTSNKYIRRIRIERAKELLIQNERSVFEIAIETGFTESQYFSTVFKQETGETPSQFRANHTSTKKPD